MKSRVTQRQVARVAGVSHATVSLALRGSALLPLKTRQRIEKIAKKLGYVPDPMLTGLAAYRMKSRPLAYHSNLAWIDFNPDRRPHNAPYRSFGDYFMGAAERARELGYGLEALDMQAIELKESRLEKILISKGITGLLLAPYPHFGGELKLDFSRFSAVRFGYSYRFPVLHTVTNAQYHTALGAFQNVVVRGYRRVGVLLDKDEDERTSWNLFGGILVGQKLHPELEPIEPFYPRGERRSGLMSWEMPDIVERLERWIRKFRIDAVIGTGHEQAVNQTGLNVGYADFSTNRSDLSGMHQNGFTIGRASVEVLVAMLNRGETGLPDMPRDILIRSTWNEGKTLPRKN